MHQQPLLAPHLPNRFSSAGHRSGVTDRIVSFMPLSLLYRAALFVDWAAPASARCAACRSWLGDFVSAKGREDLGLLIMHNLSFHHAFHTGRLVTLIASGALAVPVALGCLGATAWAQTTERRTDPAIRP